MGAWFYTVMVLISMWVLVAHIALQLGSRLNYTTFVFSNTSYVSLIFFSYFFARMPRRDTRRTFRVGVDQEDNDDDDGPGHHGRSVMHSM